MRLTSPRLLARPFTPRDVDAALAWLADPQVMAHVQPPMDREQVERFVQVAGIEKALVHAVEERDSGELVGHVIFHEWVRPGVWELGWVLRRDRWRRGYARELTQALATQARAMPEAHTLLAESDPANAASIAAIEACGLTRSPELDDPDDDLPTWALDVR